MGNVSYPRFGDPTWKPAEKQGYVFRHLDQWWVTFETTGELLERERWPLMNSSALEVMYQEAFESACHNASLSAKEKCEQC